MKRIQELSQFFLNTVSVEELETTCRSQSQGHHTIDRMEEETREAWKEDALDDLPCACFKGNFGETSQRQGEAYNYYYGLFRAQ